MKRTVLALALSTLSLTAFANVNNLSPESSWDEINKTRNIELRNYGIKVGNLNTSVFFVEEKDGVLFTKKPTRDGYYEFVNSNRGNDRQKWVQTGESIKSGNVIIQVPQYETKRLSQDRDERILTGYKEYEQPLTRKIQVYEVLHSSKDNERKRFLFEKEYTIDKKM